MSRKNRPAPPGTRTPVDVAAMIRVDHAGEYGAVRIYEGQLAVLGNRNSKATAAVRHMAEQERRHLETFDGLVNARKVRPTALEPVWRIAGFALGAASAMLGEEAAMACTVAVEEVIDTHYASQIARLGETDPQLTKTLETFRAEEVSHRDTAIAHGAEKAAGYRFLSESIKAGCRLAIALSEKI
jgi:ubiquinone biosynthesis monooxygenase Coq7